MQLKFCKNEKASILIWSLLQTCFYGEIRAKEIKTFWNDLFVVMRLKNKFLMRPNSLIVSALGASIQRSSWKASFLILRDPDGNSREKL